MGSSHNMDWQAANFIGKGSVGHLTRTDHDGVNPKDFGLTINHKVQPLVVDSPVVTASNHMDTFFGKIHAMNPTCGFAQAPTHLCGLSL
jgi:hypothetical protein